MRLFQPGTQTKSNAGQPKADLSGHCLQDPSSIYWQMPYKSPLKYHMGPYLALLWSKTGKERSNCKLSDYATEKYWFAMTKHWILWQSAKKTVLWVLKCRPHRQLSETNGNLLLSRFPAWVWRGSCFQAYFTAIGSTSIFKRKQVHCGRDNGEWWGTGTFRGIRQHRHVQPACALCSASKYRWRKNPELFKVILSMLCL